MLKCCLKATLVGLAIALPAQAGSLRMTPEVAIESRFFFAEPQFDGQLENFQGALILGGDARWTSRNRNTRLLFEPFLRLDTEDSARTYGDIREASVTKRLGDWDLLFGVTQVFWGVAESRNVVDVINQFDTVEDFDQGEKLGQPALRIGKRTDIGRCEAYYLPYFRKQILPGEDGRLRFNPAVETDTVKFERGGDEWAGDFALRYENTFGKFDVGAHVFYGTSRNPLLLSSDDVSSLEPLYQELLQGGVDVQYTSGPWLLKFEGAGVNVGGDTFFSYVGGFEYTFFGIKGAGIDIGLIGEYLYDSREGPNVPITIFEHDAFVGTRITLNDAQDTELLAGAIIDTTNGALIGSVEFQRRLGSTMLFQVEGRLFNASGDVFIGPFDRDSHLTLRLTRYF